MKLTPQINTGRFLRHGSKFFLELDILRELAQNSLRAHADRIQIDLTPEKVTFSDNGEGIPANEDAWQRLLTVGDSGWDAGIERGQDPAGMGLYAALLRYPTRIASGRTAIRTDPQAVVRLEEVASEVLNIDQPGCSIELFGEAPKEVRASIDFKVDGGAPNITTSFQASLGAFLYSLNGSPVHLLLTVDGSPVIDGLIKDQPWAQSWFDPNVPPTLTVQKPGYRQGGDSTVIPETHPGLTEEHTGITLRALEIPLRSYQTKRLFISFFGMSLEAERGIPFSTHQVSVAMVVHGENPWKLEAQLPTRKVLRNTPGWRAFLTDVLEPFASKATQHLENLEKDLGMQPIDIFPECEELQTDYANKYFDLRHSGAGTKSAINVLISLGEIRNPSRFDEILSCKLDVWPKAYQDLDVITPGLDLNWAWVDSDPEESWDLSVGGTVTRYRKTGPSVNRIAHHLAMAKQLRFGVKSKGQIPQDQLHKVAEIESYCGPTLKRIELAPNQGNYTFLILEWLGVQTLGKTWKLNQPAIVACEDEQDGGCPTWDRSRAGVLFIANPEYEALIGSDPNKAYDLFLKAANDTFTYEEPDQDVSEYDLNQFESDSWFTNAKSFFIRPKIEGELTEFLQKHLGGNFPECEHSRWENPQFFVRRLKMEKGKAELDITLQLKKKTVKGSYREGSWTFETTFRKQRPKK